VKKAFQNGHYKSGPAMHLLNYWLLNFFYVYWRNIYGIVHR